MTREYRFGNVIARFVDGERSAEERYEVIKAAAIRLALSMEKQTAPAAVTAETESGMEVTNNIPDPTACVNSKGVQYA